jgi:hypothetical protein
MADVENIINELKVGIGNIAKQQVGAYAAAAKADGEHFIEQLRIDITTWSVQLATGKLSKGDFEFLIKGRRDLAAMKGLTEAGLAAIKIDEIKNSMVTLVITVVCKTP